MIDPRALSALGKELGFTRLAVVPIEPPRRHALYTSWLAAGHAGAMAYLAAPAHVAQRADLRTLLAAARSLIVVALAYDRVDPIPPIPADTRTNTGRIWVYQGAVRQVTVS